MRGRIPLRGWLVVNGFLYTCKFTELTQMFVAAAERKGICLEVRSNTEIYTGIFELDPAVSKPDFVLFWDKDVILARYLELSGIPVYNSSRSIEVCDDKRKIYLALLEAGIPIPRTISGPMTYENVGFPTLDFVDGLEGGMGYPLIVKEAFGSFGEQVYMAENREDLERMLKAIERKPFLLQQYISASRGQDVRLQVVGDQVVAAMRRYSDNDFRANITSGGHMERYEPEEAACLLAVRACQATGCDFAGVDLLFTENGFLVCEVNSNAHFKNLYDCTGINTADYIMEYIYSRPLKMA